MLTVIKILDIKPVADYVLEINFSNGGVAHFDGAHYLSSRTGSLLDAVGDVRFFNNCFVDADAICWPNGLELSGERVFSLSKLLA